MVNLPNATIKINPQELADRLEELADRLGWRSDGHDSWRAPHYCGGQTEFGNNPGLSIRAGNVGKMLVCCHYGCDNHDAYEAVMDAAGGEYRYQPNIVIDEPRVLRPFVEPNYRAPADVPLIPGTGWPELHGGGTYTEALSAVRDVWVSWANYRLADGRPRKMLRRFPPQPNGPKSKWDGDVGRSPRQLTPFIWRPGSPMVLCEGEKAGAALYCAPGTHGVASVPGTAELQNANYATFAGLDIIIWPDADHPTVNTKTGKPLPKGPEAAAVAADQIRHAGAASVAMVSLDDVAGICPDDGADAADIPQGDIAALIAGAKVVAPASVVTPLSTPDAALKAELDAALEAELDAALEGADDGADHAGLLANIDAYLARQNARNAAPSVGPCRLRGRVETSYSTAQTTCPDSEADPGRPQPPQRSSLYRCPDVVRSRTMWLSNGMPCRVDLPCEVCDTCAAFWQATKRYQYQLEVDGGTQTILHVSDLGSSDEAQAVITSMGRRCGGTRVNIIRARPHYKFDAIVIYACKIPDEAMTLAAKAITNNSFTGTIETRHVPEDEFEGYTNNRRLMDGGQVPVRFLKWAKLPEQPSEYAYVAGEVGYTERVEHLPLLWQALEDDDELREFADTGLTTPDDRIVNRERRTAIHAERWCADVSFSGPLWHDCVDALTSHASDPYHYRQAVRDLIDDAGYHGPYDLIDKSLLYQAGRISRRHCYEVVAWNVVGGARPTVTSPKLFDDDPFADDPFGDDDPLAPQVGASAARTGNSLLAVFKEGERCDRVSANLVDEIAGGKPAYDVGVWMREESDKASRLRDYDGDREWYWYGVKVVA